MKCNLILIVLTVAPFIYSSKVCTPDQISFYDDITDNLWGLDIFRESIIKILTELRCQTRDNQIYFSLTTILDALYRKHIDIFPTFQLYSQLNNETPKKQIEIVLVKLSNQSYVSCAINEIINFLKEENVQIIHNLTNPDFDDIKMFKNLNMNEVLDIIFSVISECPPPQALIGALLLNTPVKTKVTKIRRNISELFCEESIEPENWLKILNEINVENNTLQSWLADIIRGIAFYTPNCEDTELLADGIIQFQKPVYTNDSLQKMTRRLSPLSLLTASFFSNPTKEIKNEDGVYHIPLETPRQSNEDYYHEIPVPERMRRNLERTKSHKRINEMSNFKIQNIPKSQSRAKTTLKPILGNGKKIKNNKNRKRIYTNILQTPVKRLYRKKNNLDQPKRDKTRVQNREHHLQQENARAVDENYDSLGSENYEYEKKLRKKSGRKITKDDRIIGYTH